MFELFNQMLAGLFNFGAKSRHVFGAFSTLGATFSISALSLIGMYYLAPVLWLCVASFVLAGAYEGQVNHGGISSALDRMFDPYQLKLAIVEKYLDELDASLCAENIFYKNVMARKKYCEDIETYLKALNVKKKHYLQITHFKELEKIEEEILFYKKELKKEKECLRRQYLFFLKELENPVPDNDTTQMEKAVAALIGNQAASLKKEMFYKKWTIRGGWTFAFAAGVSTGLAGLSAMKAGIAAMGFLSVIPGGTIFAMASMAAVGYGLLVYDNISNMIQDFDLQALKNYFKKRTEKNESTSMWITRCVLVVLAALLAIAATIAMAGTWYNLIPDGVKFLPYIDKVANTLRDFFLLMTALPNLVFTVSNSVESADRLVTHPEKWVEKWGAKLGWIIESFKNPLDLLNPWRSNPFRAIAKIILLVPETLFLGHVTSIGVTSDHVNLGFMPSPPTIPASTATVVAGGSEFFTDLNYMDDEDEFFALKLLFLPFKIVATVLNCFATLWDYSFSSTPRDFEKSCQRIWTIHKDNEPYPELAKPQKPQWCEDWGRQDILEVCDKERNRLTRPQSILQKMIYKQDATRNRVTEIDMFKRNVRNRGNAIAIEPDSFSLHRSRFTCFARGRTTSRGTVGAALKQYHEEKQALMRPGI